jgi:hypothetical protein
MKFLTPFFLACAFASAAHAAAPLGAGERFVFRVGWGIFVGAGEIKITGAAATDSDGNPQIKVTTTTATRGLGRALYQFNALAESEFDAKTGRIIALQESSKSAKKETRTSTTFDYKRSVAHYTNSLQPEKTAELPLPAGEPMDLITSLVQTRSWDMKPGDKRDALVLFDNDFYELTIHAIRYEEVDTSLGNFKTLVLEPRMDKTPPKGMFKRGSGVSVWISQDEKHLPVKFVVDFKFGSGVATLTHYDPPATAKEAPAAADAPNPRS